MKNFQMNGHDFIKTYHKDSIRDYYRCNNCNLAIFSSNLTKGQFITFYGPVIVINDDKLSCDDYIIKSIIE